MQNPEPSYIEDANKQKLFYHFTPAAIASNFVPLIVILDKAENESIPHFEYKMWNVLSPFYLSDMQGDLLQTLIKKIAEDYECEDHIYMYGTPSMAYTAMNHAVLCKANAVYSQAHKSMFEEKNLSDFLSKRTSFPIFYLYMSEQISKDEKEYFIELCKEKNIKYKLDFCPKTLDNEDEKIKEVLDMLEYASSAL